MVGDKKEPAVVFFCRTCGLGVHRKSHMISREKSGAVSPYEVIKSDLKCVVFMKIRTSCYRVKTYSYSFTLGVGTIWAPCASLFVCQELF